MSESTDRSVPSTRPFLLRLHYTPWSDLFRLQVSSRLDAKSLVAGAGLSLELCRTIWDVVRRTRLWRSEKVDVARELINHFEDGLEGGGNPSGLIDSFGDVKQAARLIRRAKRRCRPVWWHGYYYASRTCGIGLAVLIGFYVFLFVRFQSAEPNVAWNYMAELNAQTLAVPVEERAWPVYREALVAMKPLSEVFPDWPREADSGQADELETAEGEQGEPRPQAADMLVGLGPGSEYWGDVKRYLGENEEAIRLARQAAAMPRFGYVYNDPANAVSLPSVAGAILASPQEAENLEVLGFRLPYLDYLRHLVHLLRADAAAAVEDVDSARLCTDITAMIGMSNHLNDAAPFFVTDLCRTAYLYNATETTRRVLSEHADLLSDDQIRDLAHRLASASGGGPIRFHFEGQRAMLRDVFQRIYTDDGSGDGYLTPEGLRYFNTIIMNSASPLRESLENKATVVAVGPALSAAVAGRRELTDFSDRMTTLAELDAAKPLWERGDCPVEAEIAAKTASNLQSLRFMPALLVMGRVRGITIAAERQTMERDATLVALALELYHRRHGDWPDELDQLVPDFLPEVPKDRWDGRPLKYRVIDGEPVVYSVGIDRVDGGAEVRLARAENPYQWLSVVDAEKLPADAPDRGDLVFRPVVDEPH